MTDTGCFRARKLFLTEALLLVAMVPWCLRSTPASTPQGSPREEAAAGCSARRTDDDASAVSHVTFSGTVRKGEGYQCPFIQGFVFQLEPNEEGWEIEVRETGRGENLARLTPSLNGRSPLLISGSDFVPAASAGPNASETKPLPEKREFSFTPVPARGNGSVAISNIRLDGQQSGAKVTIAEMSFDASVNIQAVDGIPIYGPKSGAKPPKVTSAPGPELPKEAFAGHRTGVVVLWLIVAPDGTPRNVKVARSLNPELDERAVKAVRGWRFQPATKDGRPVPVQINVEVSFP